MNTRHSSRWFWTVLAVLCLTVPFLADKTAANKAAAQPQSATASVKTAGGLTVITFTVNPGTIKVNLPDDMRAGDTISGTVFAEPNGTTKEERGANQTELKKFGIRLFERSEDKPQEVNLGDISTVFKFALIRDRELASGISVGVIVGIPGNIVGKVSIPVLPLTPSGAIITPDPKITPPTHPSGAVITPDPKITPTFIIPPLGQTGRSIVVAGPFDGDSSTTSLSGHTQRILNYGAVRSAVQDFEKNTENVSGGFGLIAESPRKAVFQAPPNVTGPIELNLKEGGTETKGTFRNVGVNLSAPKTSLLKGESTTLRVEVSGLEGIKQPVPLTLECSGVITMEGGTYQPLMIQPSQVSADGRYTTTRGITGVQAGGWEATATVVTTRFNVCLQDDTAPHRRILWNTVTGEYIFTLPGWWPPKGQPGGAGWTTGESGGKTGGKTGGTTESGGTAQPADPNFPPTDPPGGLTGQGKPIRKGCILTLTHNAPDRRIFSKLDSCTTSGSSTIEDPKTTVKFTITDRNIADNTCGSQ